MPRPHRAVLLGRMIAAVGTALLVTCAAPTHAPDPVPTRSVEDAVGGSDSSVSIERPPPDAGPSDAAAPALCDPECGRDVLEDRPCGRWQNLGPRPQCSPAMPCPSRPPRWIECLEICCDDA